MNSGHQAEGWVAEKLNREGYRILARNWRTPVCEIDIVASKDQIIYFVEVKFRQQNSQGDGFDYITGKKLDQMTRAAGYWVQENSWKGDYRLMAASVKSDRSIQLLEI